MHALQEMLHATWCPVTLVGHFVSGAGIEKEMEQCVSADMQCLGALSTRDNAL